MTLSKQTGIKSEYEEDAQIFFPAGPDIDGDTTLTRQNYKEKVSKPVDIQAQDLPSEWLIRNRRGWKREKEVTWKIGLIAAGIAFLPLLSNLTLEYILPYKNIEPHPLFIWLVDILNDKWVSGSLKAIAGILGITIVQRTWKFVKEEIFEDLRLRKQVWIGGGTTEIGVGEQGLSIKNPRTLLVIDWSRIGNIGPQYIIRTSRDGHRNRERGIGLTLKPVGKNANQDSAERSEDVIFIPERFFADGESDLNWREFQSYVSEKIKRSAATNL